MSSDPVKPIDQPTAEPSSSDTPPFRYSARLAQQIETKWQDHWDAHGTFNTLSPGDEGFDASRPKKFILDMFPYPSGTGLHVGHPLGYIGTDIYARFMRMTGHNVMHAMGFDAFGLPAEQFAVQNNIHPREAVSQNIATMRAQLRRLGLAHDPRRSVSTTDESFYRWTQWIFLRVYNSWYDESVNKARPISVLIDQYDRGERKVADGREWTSLSDIAQREIIDSHRLAYLAEVNVNWCPGLGTVLANEEVTPDGRSERGNFPVYKRPLKQWVMRITSYAERLLSDLELVDWPEKVKIMQRNWIGRSEGAHADFACSTRRIRVFTTRPDTMFGATYIVLSPEHEMVDFLAADKYGATNSFTRAIFPGADELIARNATPAEMIAAYRTYASRKTDQQRGDTADKTGVFIGAYAINPVTEQRIPVYIADYVLTGYGTGAIMAVPAHDERDFEFAQAFKLPIKDVVYPRQIAAMAFYAANAFPDGNAKDGWREELSDFLGVVTSESHQHRLHAELLQLIRARRDRAKSAGVVTSIDVNAPGSVGERRGITRSIWLETLDDLKVGDFADLRARFASASFYATLGEAFTATGLVVNSAGPRLSIDGLETAAAKARVSDWLAEVKLGRKTVNFRLRDWLFSRQRYWGEPFPIVFDECGVVHALPESMLPVTLPHMDNFQPESSDDPAATVKTPLDRAPDWVNCTLDLGDGPKKYRRETNTMPNWAGSCWYYLRYLDPKDDNYLCAPEIEKYWMAGTNDGSARGGVDLYVGGVEHAVLHLLYARFWHKVLYDLGHVSTVEPFAKLFNQGYIQAHAYKDEREFYVPAHEVLNDQGELAYLNGNTGKSFTYQGKPVRQEYGKMGKSLKNSVAPDEVATEFGCDTLRVYEMSMGPLDADKPWSTRDIPGAYRFLQRVWRNLIDEQTGEPRISDAAAPTDLIKALHKTIKGVRQDMASMGFNTSIAKLIEFNNLLTKYTQGAGGGSGSPVNLVPREIAESLVLMLSPLAPHIAEELWHKLGKSGLGRDGPGNSSSVMYAPFPTFDDKLIADDQIELPVQVQGKVRARITVPVGCDAKAIEAAALADEKIKAFIENKPVKKVIVVPGKMVNIVL